MNTQSRRGRETERLRKEERESISFLIGVCLWVYKDWTEHSIQIKTPPQICPSDADKMNRTHKDQHTHTQPHIQQRTQKQTYRKYISQVHKVIKRGSKRSAGIRESSLVLPLSVLWQGQSKAWEREEGDIRGLGIHKISLNTGNYYLSHAHLAHRNAGKDCRL